MAISAGSSARLASFRKLLVHINQCILTDVGFELWDGSVLPGDLAPDAPFLAIADEGVIAALVRRPSMHTFLNLWVTARIDLRRGTIFDLVARQPKACTKDLVKKLDKRLALATEALETATYDEFAEQRIAAGRSIMDIFPPADDVLREYQEWKKSR